MKQFRSSAFPGTTGYNTRATFGHPRRRAVARAVNAVEMLEQRMLLTASPIISEIMPGNKSTLADQAGAYVDWLEICNPDPQQSVALGGYKLQYTSSKGNVTTWAFPTMSLGPNQYRVIFCDSTPQYDPNGELHTNFNLSKSGASISLLDSSDNVVQPDPYAPYPAVQSGTSYGTGQSVAETPLVAAGDVAHYLIPTSSNSSLDQNWFKTSFNDSSWSQGATGLGFANQVSGFAVTAYKASLSSIPNLATAQSVISTPSNQSWTKSENAPVFNYLNTGGSGQFVNDRTVPGMTIGNDVDCYVVQGIANLTVPAAGTYTFDLNSDDGGLVTIDGQTVCSFDGLRGASDSLGKITLAAGVHSLTVMYFENAGGSSGELSAALGDYTAGFNAAAFHLVGDTANGGLAVSSPPVASTGTGNSASFVGNIATNVQSAMQAANNASLYVRMDFSAPSLPSTLTLKMAYDDGYVAWLNGVKVASSNAPANPAWNSTATAARAIDLNATTFENVDLTAYISLLQPTGNVLAIQAMNVSATDGDMLVMPVLSQMVLTPVGEHIFAVPTPGAPNTIDTWQPDLTFSVQHGFFTQPFPLSLSTTITGTAATGASIFFSTNGATPFRTVTSLTASGTTVTATMAGHGFLNGDQVMIAGASPASYNGSFTIANVTANTFTYALSAAPSVSPATGAMLAAHQYTGASLTVTSLKATGTSIKATVTSHGFSNGDLVQISGASPAEYNGSFTIANVTTNTFTYTLAAAPSVSSATGTMSAARQYTQSTGPTQTVSALAASGTTVTAMAANHGYSAGDRVLIVGALPVEYNGRFTIAGVTANTFTYALAATPSASSASGSMSAAKQYPGPITINTSTVVRAVSSIAGGQGGVVSTETYIFPSAVINQSNQSVEAAGFPSSWVAVPADYAMDPRITTDPAYKSQMSQDLLSLPAMSIVTDMSNLFDPSTGLYVNANNGNATNWERPISMEYFSADGTQDLQVNCALQMQGGVGRYDVFEKHSFRLKFQSSYGPSKLVYPLFGDGATDTFDTVTLRAGFNDAWVWGGDEAQFIRDQFANRTLLAMGQPAGHGTYVQLYINGVYWGLYNPVERPDASFASSYLGGDKTQWDAIANQGPANNNNTQSLTDLMSFFDNYDVSTTAGFQRLQGNNPDGTPNSAYANLLDVGNYIDYMLMEFYIGNTDWPGHNYYMGRLDTATSTGFKCFPWDSEMSVDGGWTRGNVNVDVTGAGSTNNDVARPYYLLKNNPDFKRLFADHAQRFLFNNGALTPAATVARYKTLADFVGNAIVTESARWGDIPGTATSGEGGTVPKTYALWATERDYILNTWLPQRTAIVIQQLRNVGLLPTIDPPSFSVNGVQEYGGTFNLNDTLAMAGAGNTIYYTTDGTDPRPADNAKGASITSVGTTATATVPGHGYATGNRVMITGTSDSAYNGIFTITGVTANTFTYTMTAAAGSSPASGAVAVRKVDAAINTINLSGSTATISFTNPGFVNGDMVRIFGATQSQYNGDFTISNVTTTSFTITVSGSPATPATGTIAVTKLTPTATKYLNPLILTQGIGVKARTFNGTTWSALADVGFYVNLAPSIRITELMYNPAAPTPAEVAAGYTDNNSFEFVEIKNIGTQTLPLQGLRFSDAVSFTFPNVSIAPGAYMLVVANIDAFRFRYPGVNPALIAGQYTGQFNNGGEHVQLDAPNGGVVLSFTYDNKWYGPTDGDGFSLTIRDPLQATTLWDSSDGWRDGTAPGGTPGTSDTLPNPGTVIFNEVLAHPSQPQGGMIELYNTTAAPVNIGGWFLSDSSSNRTKYAIAAGTTIAANGYLVLTQSGNFGAAFALSGNGGDLYLASNASGVAGGYREHVTIDPTPVDVSIGRISKSTGGTDFGLLQTPTFGTAPNYTGAPNSVAYSSPIVMNEIMYNPAAPTPAEIAAGYSKGNVFEYIELYNRSTTPQDLRQFYIGDGVGFSFGWCADGTAKSTLESDATATWSTTGLSATSYDVYAHLRLVDANGKRRT
ncbi:MAG: lamin tail domain-containing protein, partial [Tepidisphaerales bacterium]